MVFLATVCMDEGETRLRAGELETLCRTVVHIDQIARTREYLEIANKGSPYQPKCQN
jgi:hypothetical protein